jgi:hypothetical protein
MSLREAAPGGDRTEFTMIPAWDELNSFGQSPGQMPDKNGRSAGNRMGRGGVVRGELIRAPGPDGPRGRRVRLLPVLSLR